MRRRTMHPALHIQELLCEIFQFIGERSETRRPTLNALVQVCKTFYEPAMNELWHTQKSLLPFILLLKGGAIQVRDIPNDEENGFDDDEMEDDDGLFHALVSVSLRPPIDFTNLTTLRSIWKGVSTYKS